LELTSIVARPKKVVTAAVRGRERFVVLVAGSKESRVQRYESGIPKAKLPQKRNVQVPPEPAIAIRERMDGLELSEEDGRAHRRETDRGGILEPVEERLQLCSDSSGRRGFEPNDGARDIGDHVRCSLYPPDQPTIKDPVKETAVGPFDALDAELRKAVPRNVLVRLGELEDPSFSRRFRPTGFENIPSAIELHSLSFQPEATDGVEYSGHTQQDLV
jgi:hypothetical protein